MSGYAYSPSPGQLRVLRAIAKYQAERGYAPAVRDLCAALDIGSTNGVNDHLAQLESKGFITRDPMTARSIVITDEGQRWVDEDERRSAGPECCLAGDER